MLSEVNTKQPQEVSQMIINLRSELKRLRIKVIKLKKRKLDINKTICFLGLTKRQEKIKLKEMLDRFKEKNKGLLIKRGEQLEDISHLQKGIIKLKKKNEDIRLIEIKLKMEKYELEKSLGTERLSENKYAIENLINEALGETSGIKEVTDSVTNMQQEINNVGDIIREILKETKDLEETKQRIIKERKQIKQLQIVNNKKLNATAEDLTQDLNEKKNKLYELEGDIQFLSESSSHKRQTIEDLRGLIRVAKDKRKGITAKSLTAKLKELQDENINVFNERESLKEQIGFLEEYIQDAQQYLAKMAEKLIDVKSNSMEVIVTAVDSFENIQKKKMGLYDSFKILMDEQQKKIFSIAYLKERIFNLDEAIKHSICEGKEINENVQDMKNEIETSQCELDAGEALMQELTIRTDEAMEKIIDYSNLLLNVEGDMAVAKQKLLTTEPVDYEKYLLCIEKEKQKQADIKQLIRDLCWKGTEKYKVQLDISNKIQTTLSTTCEENYTTGSSVGMDIPESKSMASDIRESTDRYVTSNYDI